jgi:protein-tyrosine-phosphatase
VPHLVTLCTGNAARSVIAGAVLVDVVPGARVSTRGTHVVEGLPMSWRTRDALRAIGAGSAGHRSRQLDSTDLDHADLVIAMSREHVEYVRRLHPGAAVRTATLRRLARDLPAHPAPLHQRVAGLRLDAVVLEPWEDIEDPAGGEIEDFVVCARVIDTLVRELRPALDTTGQAPPSA